MAAVLLVVRSRLARRGRALAATSVLLGIGFGLCFASLAAARRTASAYDRILAATDAPDAAVSHRIGMSPEDAEASLRSIDAITEQRVYAGFLGISVGIDPAYTRALIAPAGDRFPLELPKLRAGRLPRADAPDEAFVNAATADAERLAVGQRVTFSFFIPQGEETTEAAFTIVGIGSVAAEAVTDETGVLGLWVFTRAFYETHRDIVVYSVSNVFLEPGFDARRDLAPAVGALGHGLQSARGQEQHSVDEALRPTVIVLAALGLLAFTATAVAAGQLIQRDRDRWSSESATLIAAGMVRGQVRLVQLMTSAVIALATVATALVTMALASPVAPVGALHDIDPAQGFGLDRTIAVAGAAAILATIAALALVFSWASHRATRAAAGRSASLANAFSRPAAVAGLMLAFRADRGRGRMWRSVTATTLATALFALGVAFVASAVTLSATPSRYGFDADLLAVNQYGNQSPADLDRVFAHDDDVVAAAGFISATFLLNGRAVPGLAATAVKGALTPTLVRGEPARTNREIVVGQDTLDSLGADVGDLVRTQLLAEAGEPARAAGDPVDLRIVGVATFPPVRQAGTDMARLGVGALVTRAAFILMGGDPRNGPEFTAVRLAAGTDPAAVIERNPAGFRDSARTKTSWFTDAKPAELRQLDVGMPYLRAALVFGYVIVLAVIVHALWSLVRANRRDLAVLRAMGCTSRQLDEVTAWQAVPFAGAALLVGLPIGIVLGRWTFTRFAQSLAVVDDASIPLLIIAAVVVALLLAVLVAVVVSVVLGRRSRAAAVLREPGE